MAKKPKTIKIEVQPPLNQSWKESLRFCCQTLSHNDPLLDYFASFWSFSIKNGGLTDKQVTAIKPLVDAHIFRIMG